MITLDELNVADEAPGIGHNAPPEPTPEERYRAIDPEKLCLLGADEIGPLLDVQFPELKARSVEFQDAAEKWKAEHRNGAVPIADEVENANLAVKMKQLRDFSGPDGEVDSARKAVKIQPFEVIKAIDGWFKSLMEPIDAALGPSKRAPVGTMQYAMDQYLIAKARKEQDERDRVAREAQQEAARKMEEARKLAETTASDAEVDRAVEDATEAHNRADAVTASAAAPIQSMGVTRSASGVRAGLVGTWGFDDTKIDIKALCAAVARGDAPVTFVTVVPAAINQAIRAKISPLRECPGLVIEQSFSSRRT